MYLDADERLDKILCEYITSIVQSNNKARQYGMERYMLFNGYEFHHGIFLQIVYTDCFQGIRYIGLVKSMSIQNVIYLKKY